MENFLFHSLQKKKLLHSLTHLKRKTKFFEIQIDNYYLIFNSLSQLIRVIILNILLEISIVLILLMLLTEVIKFLLDLSFLGFLKFFFESS